MGSADGPEGGVGDSVGELVVEAGFPMKASAAGNLKLLIVLNRKSPEHLRGAVIQLRVQIIRVFRQVRINP